MVGLGCVSGCRWFGGWFGGSLAFTVGCWFSLWVYLVVVFKNFVSGLAGWLDVGLDSWYNVSSWVGLIVCGWVWIWWFVFGWFAGSLDALLLGCCGKRFGVWRWFAFGWVV